MKENLGWILFVVAVLFILYSNTNKTNDKSLEKASGGNSDDVQCELKDAYGRIITIKGSSSDPQFIRMCQSQANQQIYVYGYPYTFIRYWSPRPHWRRRPSPPTPATPPTT